MEEGPTAEPIFRVEDNAQAGTSNPPDVNPSAASDQARHRFGGKHPNLNRMSFRFRSSTSGSGRESKAVETARVAAMLASVRTPCVRNQQPELYTVPEGEESDEEPAAAHAAPRTVQESKELLDRVERMRKFKSHDYEPPVRFQVSSVVYAVT